MQDNYIGKICPYCKTPLRENDAVVICGTCDTPQHLACWQAKQGCTTFGCNGRIRAFYGVQNQAPAPQPVPMPQAAPVPAPAPQKAPEAKPVAQSMEVIQKSNELVFLGGVPLVLEGTELIIDRNRNKLFARCTFQSITDRPMKAVMVELACKDVWGEDLGEAVPYQYLDLQTKRGAQFGQENMIELANETTRQIRVTVKKLLYADGSVEEGGGAARTMPAPVLLSQHLGSRELAEEYAKETTPKAKYVPQTDGDCWMCTCGALHMEGETRCHLCGCEKDELIAALDAETLQTNLQTRRAEENAAAEKAAAERAEMIRQAEEQVRLEREQKEAERREAEEQAKKIKRRKNTLKAVIAALIVVTILAGVFVFWGIPYMNYQQACQALANHEYMTAIGIFSELGDFMDSPAQLLEAKYGYAGKCIAGKNFSYAYELYTELGSYRDCQDKLDSCVSQWVEYMLKNDSTRDAEVFQKTVKLKTTDYTMVYNQVWNYISENPELSHWRDTSGVERAKVVCTLLGMLPQEYSSVAELKEFMSIFTPSGWSGTGVYVQEKAQDIRVLWDLELLKNYIESNYVIKNFLVGDWRGSGYYFIIDEDDHQSHYDLPWVAEPKGTKYYDIDDMIYYFDNKDNEHLEKVFRFEFVDYDTIRVYCYKNQRTYKLYRQ